MTRMPGVDVAVIGGGVVGCASAYELTRAGARVALIEAGNIASVASGASAGGVRQQGRDLRELPIAIRAIQRWPELTDELGANLDYRQDGHITLAEREEDLPGLERRVETEREHGLDVCMVYGDDLRELVPDVAPHVVAGSWCRTDGHAMPALVSRAFARGAARLGAAIYEQTVVTGVQDAGGCISGVETSRSTIPCRWVLNAAGAWSPAIARMVGIELPITTRGLQMMVTEVMPPRLRPVLGCIGRRLSLKQLPSGNYLIGGGWPGSVDQDRRIGRNLLPSMAGSADHAGAVYPLLRETRVLRAWIGLEAIAADEVPILGPVPGVEGFVVASGFSGHGFALAPYIGVLMAELITTGRTSMPIESLGISRFAA